MCPFGAIKKVVNNIPDFFKVENWGGGAVGTECLFYFIYPTQLPEGWSETPCILLNA